MMFNMNILIDKNYLVKKKFGQVFLTEKKFIEKIVFSFNPIKNQNIVEIGPGFGSLTFPIFKFVKKMNVIEIDKDLSNILKKHNKFNDNLKIIIKDVRKVNFFHFFKKGKLIRIIGNLPYNISISVIFYLLKYTKIIEDMYLMLQKEVAERLLAQPNSKKYGILSVIIQYMCKIIHITDIPSVAFTPIPKVNSTMVALIPYRKNPYRICDFKILNYIVKKAFNQRRKIIKNSLNFFQKEDFLDIGINPYSRAEDISINDFCSLTYKFLKNK